MRPPRKTEVVVCTRCENHIEPNSFAFSEDGDIQDYWCDHCVDYVRVKMVPKWQREASKQKARRVK